MRTVLPVDRTRCALSVPYAAVPDAPKSASQYLVKLLQSGLGYEQVIDKSGERGRIEPSPTI
jgi:hypothetical protein